MTRLYRTYSTSWDRTGYSDQPQFPGQEAIEDGRDFPPACPDCGRSILGIGMPAWLFFRGTGPADAWKSEEPYVAWCSNKHIFGRRPIGDAPQ